MYSKVFAACVIFIAFNNYATADCEYREISTFRFIIIRELNWNWFSSRSSRTMECAGYQQEQYMFDCTDGRQSQLYLRNRRWDLSFEIFLQIQLFMHNAIQTRVPSELLLLLSITHMSHLEKRITKFFLIIVDNKTKTVEYAIPINETHVEQGVNASQCSDGVDTLKVSWSENSFLMTFEQNKTTEKVKFYDLSSFVISLNVSGLFNDSAGKHDESHLNLELRQRSAFIESKLITRFNCSKHICIAEIHQQQRVW